MVTYDQDGVQRLREELDDAIGHYMVAVSVELLDEGLPVVGISAFGSYDDPSQADFDGDVEGSVEFTQAFQRRLTAEGAVRAFCGAASRDGVSSVPPRLRTGTHALGPLDGRGPPLRTPARVAAFLSEVRLDPAAAGSAERPFYRAPRAEPQALLARLRGIGDEAAAGGAYFDHRFASVRAEAYQERVLAALTEPEQDLVDLVLHTGELESLVRFLEYVEGAAPRPEARELARRLGSDLALRARDGRDSHQEHRTAIAYAVEQG